MVKNTKQTFGPLTVHQTKNQIELYMSCTNENAIGWGTIRNKNGVRRSKVYTPNARNSVIHLTKDTQRELLLFLIECAEKIWTTFRPQAASKTDNDSELEILWLHNRKTGRIQFKPEQFDCIHFEAPNQRALKKGLHIGTLLKKDVEHVVYTLHASLERHGLAPEPTREEVRYRAFKVGRTTSHH